ncbi:MAG: DUF4956 domain-containing protein [Crocinitomicaceae bacterium]|nr:DUF4956 domain-containing protein [Crocinitomicaceae bacterium]|tara:strand:- start:2809 stop:3456 length:648 start_codon:yes stop_codon:yes gene_type:complete
MELLLNDITLMVLAKARLFDIKFYDKDFLELLVRFAFNILISYTIILKVFNATKKDSEYLFTYLIFSPVVFFICHMFASTKLSIGFAFGLFAVFSILRYRTTTIPVKEMSYMFIIIAVAVINAISTKKISYAELIFTNVAILGLTFFLERFLFGSEIITQLIHYEKVENIKPENANALKADLEERIGTTIERYDILEADFLRDSAKIMIYYKRTK